MSETLSGAIFLLWLVPFSIYAVALINYRIDDEAVRFYWGPIPIRRVAIDDIADVQRGLRHMSESWANTLWIPTLRRRSVTLYRKTGGGRRVVLTPDDPGEFIEQILCHRCYQGRR